MISLCRSIGKNLGYCFQIRDDIFDYFNEVQIGKPTGNDLREGKVTLPLLYALRQGGEETNRYRKMILTKDFTEENISALISFAKKQGGIAYAEQRMQEYYLAAIEQLQQLPKSAARQSLLELADFITRRKK